MDIITTALDKLGFDWQIALANLINFALVYLLLNKLVFKKLAAAIQERKQLIEAGVAHSAEAENILKHAREEAEMLKRDAKQKAVAIMADASDKAQVYTLEARQNAAVLEEQLVSSAKKQAESTFQNELLIQKEQLAEKIVDVAEKILQDEITGEKQKSFVLKQLNTNTIAS